MTIYGNQADYELNKNKGAQLYVPGKTQLSQNDIFLGGTGTGVGDDQLNGARRIYGTTAQDTANAFTNYNPPQKTTEQQYQIPQGARVTLAMRDYLTKQAQNQRDYQTSVDQYNQAFDAKQKQSAFDNNLNEGQLMGTYNNNPTLQKQAQAIQDAQYKAGLAQDESQFGRTLAIQRQNANRPSTSSSAATIAAEKANNLASALSDVQDAFDKGMSPTEVRQNIMSRSSDYEQIPGVTVAALLARVDQYEKSWGKTDGENNPNPTVPDQTSNTISAWNSLNNIPYPMINFTNK